MGRSRRGRVALPSRGARSAAGHGQALGLVLHRLGQAGEGHSLAGVQPACTVPDLIVPHGLPVAHGSLGMGGSERDTREQVPCPHPALRRSQR